MIDFIDEDKTFASSYERNQADAERIREGGYEGHKPGPYRITRYPEKETSPRHIRSSCGAFLACENVAGQANAASLQLMADAPMLLEENKRLTEELRATNARVMELELILIKIGCLTSGVDE